MILAGAFISIACMAYRACGNHVIGSAAFAVGLVLVCILGADLYTGRIGYAKWRDWPEMVAMLLINLLTAAAMGALSPGFGPDKLSVPILPAFGRAILCGVLVYAAVEGWRRTKQILAVAIPTAAFVLIGAEHCVADAFWIFAAGSWSWYAALWLLVVIIGNSIGSIAVKKAMEVSDYVKAKK